MGSNFSCICRRLCHLSIRCEVVTQTWVFLRHRRCPHLYPSVTKMRIVCYSLIFVVVKASWGILKHFTANLGIRHSFKLRRTAVLNLLLCNWAAITIILESSIHLGCFSTNHLLGVVILIQDCHRWGAKNFRGIRIRRVTTRLLLQTQVLLLLLLLAILLGKFVVSIAVMTDIHLLKHCR